MRKEKMQQTPSGMAGLVRYYDEDRGNIKLKPMHVVGLVTFVIIIELLLFIFL